MPSEAQKRASAKWQAANMTTIGVKMRRDMAAEFAVLAERNGTTRNALIRGWIMDYIDQHREQQSGPPQPSE